LENDEKSHTKGVSLLLGDPKKAILHLSIPTIIAMVINSLYALIDGIWVAGLGGNALAAIGFVNPLFLIIMGFSNGLGAGATSVISRYIGEKNKKQADNSALHVILLIAILTIIFTIVLLLFLKEILIAIGTGSEVLDLSMTYGQILFIGSVFIVFSSTAYGILRAEGNVTKTTYGMLVGAVINMILDPIFIYQFNMGVFGAGLATIISLAIVSMLILYWFKEETYIDFSFKNFIYDNKLIKQILNVGLPAGFEYLMIAISSGFLNLILMIVSNVQGVAVYTAGWRVVMFGIVTPIAIGISVVAVTGANYGGKRYENLKIIQNYSAKLGLIIVSLITLIILIFAPYISYIFSYGQGQDFEQLRVLITDFLRVTCLFYLAVPIGITATSIFQGIGKGFYSLIFTTLRLVIFEIIFAYILAILLGFGQYGVWGGIVLGNVFGAIIAFIYSKYYIKNLIKIKT